MLPLKWKIFRVISYLHMILSVMMGVYIIYMLFSRGIRVRSTIEVLTVSMFVLFSASLLGNSSINLYLLERFFPDKVPGNKIRIFSRILFVLALLATLFVLICEVAMIYDVTSKRYDISLQYMLAYLILSGIAVLGLSGCYILWNQVSLRKAIRRNYEASLNSFLESDQP